LSATRTTMDLLSHIRMRTVSWMMLHPEPEKERKGEEPIMDEDRQAYNRVRASVRTSKVFYIHASVFVVVNVGLFAINALTGGLAGGVWWFYWPLFGWGIGLGAHALGVFGFGSGGGPLGREWEKRKTQEMMDKERGS
jgi:hypothetical protein